MGPYVHQKAGSGHLRISQQPQQDAWARLRAPGLPVPSRQPFAAYSKSRLLPLLRLRRQIYVSDCQGGNGEAPRKSYSSRVDRRSNYPYLSLPGPLLPLARFRRSAKRRSSPEYRRSLQESSAGKILAADPRVPDRRGISPNGRANSLESLHSIFHPPRECSAAAPVRPPGKHRLVSPRQKSSWYSPLSGCSSGQYLRQLPCLLESANQDRRVSPEVSIPGGHVIKQQTHLRR